ncbi:hypothetical protein [Dyella subtropica]|uniref:hypothetical protein n=1 Tax=Dyella subtropica TaxID=2992127 RepID=UPI00224D6302|nr:hypothetical protein [Dyella subtropica]
MQTLTQELKNAHAVIARSTIENALHQLESDSKEFPELKPHHSKIAEEVKRAIKGLTQVWGDFHFRYDSVSNTIRIFCNGVNFDSGGNANFIGRVSPATSAPQLTTDTVIPLSGMLPSRNEVLAYGLLTIALTIQSNRTFLVFSQNGAPIGQMEGPGVSGANINNAPGSGQFSA